MKEEPKYTEQDMIEAFTAGSNFRMNRIRRRMEAFLYAADDKKLEIQCIQKMLFEKDNQLSLLKQL